MCKKRLVYKQLGNLWVKTEMKLLNIGDIFKMYDPGDKIVTDKDNNSIFIVTDEPYEKDGVWGVQSEPVKNDEELEEEK